MDNGPLAELHPGDLTVCPDTRCGLHAEVIDAYEIDGAGGRVRHVITQCLFRHRYHQIHHPSEEDP